MFKYWRSQQPKGIQKSELSNISEIRSETSKTSFYHMFPGEGVTGHLFYYFPEETNISYSRRDWEKKSYDM